MVGAEAVARQQRLATRCAPGDLRARSLRRRSRGLPSRPRRGRGRGRASARRSRCSCGTWATTTVNAAALPWSGGTRNGRSSRPRCRPAASRSRRWSPYAPGLGVGAGSRAEAPVVEVGEAALTGEGLEEGRVWRRHELRHRSVLLVLVEPGAALSAELAGGDQLAHALGDGVGVARRVGVEAVADRRRRRRARRSRAGAAGPSDARCRASCSRRRRPRSSRSARSGGPLRTGRGTAAG